MKDKSRIFLNSVIVFAATIFENIIFFVINIIIARYLSLDQFGEYTTALGYATFFSTLTNIGINQTLVMANNRDPEHENENFSTALYVKAILALVIYAVMSASLYCTNYSGELVVLTLIMGIFRMGNELLSVFYTFYDSKEVFLRSSLFRISFSITFLIMTSGIVYFRGGLFDFVYIRVWLVVIFLLILILTSAKMLTLKINLKMIPGFLRQSIPFGIQSFLVNIYQRSNIIILSLFHGTVYSGTFSNGFIFFTTLFMIPDNISRVIIPYLYKASFTDESEKFYFAYEIYTKYMTMISFYLMMGAVLYAEKIILLIFGQKYYDSIYILKIIAVGIPFIFTVAPAIITTLDRQHTLAKIYIYGFVINIISNFVLIHYLKSEGAAIAAVITYGFIFIACNYYLILNKIINFSGALKPVVGQIIIITICFAVFKFLPVNLNWLISLTFLSFLFFILNLIFIVNKNDARILMEILNIKNFPVKIYK